jgi:hypothetical protein
MYNNKSSKISHVSLFLLVGCLALVVSLSPRPVVIHAQSGDEAEIRAVVHKFLTALQKKDAETLKSLWSEKSSGNAGTKQDSEPALEALGEMDLPSLTINQISTVAAGEVGAWVTIMSNADLKGGKPDAAVKRTNLTVHLGKEGGA